MSFLPHFISHILCLCLCFLSLFVLLCLFFFLSFFSVSSPFLTFFFISVFHPSPSPHLSHTHIFFFLRTFLFVFLFAFSAEFPLPPIIFLTHSFTHARTPLTLTLNDLVFSFLYTLESSVSFFYLFIEPRTLTSTHYPTNSYSHTLKPWNICTLTHTNSYSGTLTHTNSISGTLTRILAHLNPKLSNHSHSNTLSYDASSTPFSCSHL